jgi:hypothetical protein
MIDDPSITDVVVLRCATHSAMTMLSRQPRLGKAYIISPLVSRLVKPFFSCKCETAVDIAVADIDSRRDLDGNEVLVSEDDVESTLRSIGRLLVGTEPHHILVEALWSS